MSNFPIPPEWVYRKLFKGQVIPAHPLALTPEGKLDERSQKTLTRYYHASGAGGLAVGVHTTQFEIREPKVGLFKPVLELASEEIARLDTQSKRKTIRIAGIVGKTKQAIEEASFAKACGYHIGLLSLSAFKDNSVEEMLAHCHSVAEVMPLMGFYLQPSVGGCALPERFWQKFAEIPNVVGIKVAPFNRYQTLDVLKGVARSSRANSIALYTGNDDHIILDLISTWQVEAQKLQFVGGLLGHWACWTSKAVEHLKLCKQERTSGAISPQILNLAQAVTWSNAALFDVRNNFRGCIAGIHYVLHKQGLMQNTRCLNPQEFLSEGQATFIDDIYQQFPSLTDDAFVAEHLESWRTP